MLYFASFTISRMISKNSIKLIHSLAHKKYRQKERLFLVEGDKNVLELINSGYRKVRIWATRDFILRYETLLKNNEILSEVNHEDLARASLLKNPQNSLALCEIPDQAEIPVILPDDLLIFLDGIQDPGNLGTILRTCDWFGIKTVFCSPDTVDLYNPKVIQASMGSFCRIQTHYIDFSGLFPILKNNQVPVYGTFMEGDNVYHEKLPGKCLIIFGNEGNGIRNENEKYISHRIKIPSFTQDTQAPESLNVAITTAIFCAEHRRQNIVPLFKMKG